MLGTSRSRAPLWRVCEREREREILCGVLQVQPARMCHEQEEKQEQGRHTRRSTSGFAGSPGMLDGADAYREFVQRS